MNINITHVSVSFSIDIIVAYYYYPIMHAMSGFWTRIKYTVYKYLTKFDLMVDDSHNGGWQP